MANEGKKGGIRRRLIEAAGELFAKKGFRETTVRDICKRADTNIAAVNYHFKGKEQLFEEVIIDVIRTGWTRYPVGFGLEDAKNPQERLKAFVRAFLLRRFDFQRPAWHGSLLRRETFLTSPGAHKFLVKHIAKNREILISIVKDLLGPGAGEELVRLCSASVIGQLLFFTHPRPEKKNPLVLPPTNPEEIEEIACHITEFSLAGIEILRKRFVPGNGRMSESG